MYHQNSFVTKVYLQAQPPNYLTVVDSLITTENLVTFITEQQNYNKTAILPFKNCDWSRDYQL